MQKKLDKIDTNTIRSLIDTALGKTKADMVVTNANLVNVYSGELLTDWSVAIKGDRIAYVGEGGEHTIGPDTRVIDANGKVLAPGFIDTHTHLQAMVQVDEFLKYAIRGGTTSIVTETIEFAVPVGYSGVRQFLKAIDNQPVKIFATIAPTPSFSPAAQSDFLQPAELRKLLRHKGVVGLGETPWPFILQGDENLIQLYAETLNAGKRVEGHSAGARGNNLQAYIAAGVSSCHESTNVEEALERLRLGLHVMIREGSVRRELESIASIKDKPVDYRRLVLCTDGTVPEHLMKYGYMEFVVQKAVDLGFNPIVAIQMATLNPAEHFSLDNVIGGIAPGKYADMVILPDLQTIQAEMVISSGQIIAREGQVIISPRKHVYPESMLRSVHLPRKLEPADFRVPVDGRGSPVTVRVINLVSGLVTREQQITIIPENGLLQADIGRDILKVSFIDRTRVPGKMFTGFVKGFNFRKGAFASSATWGGLSGIIVVGVNDADMAGAVNRIKALKGGVVVYSEGKVLAEMPLPIAGYVSDLPIETVNRGFKEIQRGATDLGTSLPDANLSLIALNTSVIPFFRICESGLMDISNGELVDLFV